MAFIMYMIGRKKKKPNIVPTNKYPPKFIINSISNKKPIAIKGKDKNNMFVNILTTLSSNVSSIVYPFTTFTKLYNKKATQ